MNSSNLSIRRFGNGASAISLAGARATEGLDFVYRILLAIILIEFPLQIDSYLAHNAEQARFGAISGFSISPSTVCLLVIYALWLPSLVVGTKSIRLSKPLTFYFAMVVISVVWAGDRSRSLHEIFLLSQAFLTFVFIQNHVKRREDILFVVGCLVVGLMFQGIAMAAARMFDRDFQYGPLEIQIYSKSKRVSGSLGSPNVASGYLSVLIPLTLGLLLTPISNRNRIFCIAAVLLGCVGLILTQSRGGWLATGIAVVGVGFVAFRNRWLDPRIAAVLAIGVLCVTLSFQSVLTSRLMGDDGGSAAARFPLARISQQIIVANPLGVGANNWELAARKYANSSEYIGEWFYTVHNKYLLVLSETGWPGLLAFVAFLFSAVFCGCRAVNRRDRVLSPIALGLTAAIIAQAIHMSSEIFNSRIQIQMLLIVAALIFAIDYVTHRSMNAIPAAE